MSAPSPPSTPNPVNSLSNAPSVSPVPANPPSHMTTGSHFGITPSGIRLTVCTLTGTAWPEDLILDLGKSNWIEWSRKLSLIVLQQGFKPWLNGSLPCPDATAAAEANFIWNRNDGALRGFIQDRVSPADEHLIQPLATAHLMFEALKAEPITGGNWQMPASRLPHWERNFQICNQKN